MKTRFPCMHLAPLVASALLVATGCDKSEPTKSGARAAADTASAAPVVVAPPISSATAAAPAKPAPTATNENVQVGKAAPDFTGKTFDGKSVTLSAINKGKPVVVYFYPRDETPGCTKEACSFRDAWKELAATNVTLVGVSMDNADAHKEFIDHWKLPFVLVSDEDGAIADKFGVPVIKDGDESYEARQTFVIGADGKVKKIYRKVDVQKHAGEVLADLKAS